MLLLECCSCHSKQPCSNLLHWWPRRDHLQCNTHAPRLRSAFSWYFSLKSALQFLTMITICLWGLCILVRKLPLMPYESCATKCYQTVLCYLPNFTNIAILITLNIGTKIFVLSGISLRHYQSLMLKSLKTDNENATEASYRASYHTALEGEVYTVAETIINHVRCQRQLVCLVSSHKKRLETVQLSIMITICLWGLHIPVMKMSLRPYVPCATKCYNTVLCYLPNFIDTVILITLNIGTKILVLSGVSLRHYQNVRALGWRVQKLTIKMLLRPPTEWVNHTALAGEMHTLAETVINHVWWQQQLVCLVNSWK